MPLRKLSLFALSLAFLASLALARADAHGRPGDFDYYTLVLSWSPTFCETHSGWHSGGECNGHKHYGFILHGLWPQYDKGWPLDCPLPRRPWVPKSVIAQMRDIMPNKGLVIHEYRAHGTCSGLSPAAFFAKARAAFHKITIPQSLTAPKEQEESSAAAIKKQFLAVNAWLKPSMMTVSCRKDDLLDVRFCFNKDLSPRLCGTNETEARACPTGGIEIPGLSR